MNDIVFNLSYAHASEKNNLKTDLSSVSSAIRNAVGNGYDSEYASVQAPFDVGMHSVVKRLIATKKTLNPDILVVIGIGGSNLGAMAVHQALYGRLYNESLPSLKVYFADTVDVDYMQDLYGLLQVELQQGKKVILNAISKSGTTLETVANIYMFVELLRSFHPRDYYKYVVITSDKNSKLHVCAQEKDIAFLEIPKQVGGRYSVFSPVGLFPLGMLGVNIDELVDGAKAALSVNTSGADQNKAMQTARIRASLYHDGININDLFSFSVDLEGIGKWYRQLMGESIGKEYDTSGNVVECGITPTVSMGTVDLHSVGQLYLGGPRDKLFTFLDVVMPKAHAYIPSDILCDVSVAIEGKSVSSIHHAIFSGVCKAFEKTKRPFIQILLPEKNAFYVGQLLQYMMIEMMYLGYLLDVNPFDQPNVELYKQETRKILNNE